MNQPLEFPFGFYTNDNTPQDGKYFNRLTLQPYADMSTALSLLPIGVRYMGLTININGLEYWWPANDSDLSKNPVIKIFPTSQLDGKVEGGNIDISAFGSGNITVGATKWLLTVGGTQSLYQTTTGTLFTGIGLSSTGNQRYVAFYGNSSNVIVKVEGTQSAAAVLPSTPANTVLLGYVLITDATISPPVVDLSGYAQKGAPNVFTKPNTFQDDTEFKKTPTINGVPIGSFSKASVADINTGTDDSKGITPLGIEGSKYLDRAFAKISATTSGTSTVYTASLTPALTSYVAGQPLVLTFNVANGANATVNVNSLGARNLARIDGTNVLANDLATGTRYIFIDDGTKYRLITPIGNQYISNQNSALQTAAALWIATGRFDTGIGLGVANNVATWINILANTAAKSSMRINPSSVDVTSPSNGDFYLIGGEIKAFLNSLLVRILKTADNELLKGSDERMMSASPDGAVSAIYSIKPSWIINADVISAIQAATFSEDKIATISPATGKAERGQFWYDSTKNILYYSYDVAGNKIMILSGNIVVDSAGVKYKIRVSTGGVLSTVIA